MMFALAMALLVQLQEPLPTPAHSGGRVGINVDGAESYADVVRLHGLCG